MQTKKIQQMVSVAQLYYMQGMKQSDIAKKMGVARSTISMILAQAKDTGIVKIEVCDPFKVEQKYTHAFHEKFGIDTCYTVETSLEDVDDVMDLVTSRAGELFDEMLTDNLTIGIAWGVGCYKFISRYVANTRYSNIDVVPLIGGSDLNCYKYPQNEMIRQFAEKLGGHASYIYAPLISDSKEERDMYMNSSSMRGLIKKWEQLDIAIVGIGNEPRYNKIFLNENMKEAKELNLCGDLCGLFFDVNGDFPKNCVNEKTVSITPELLKKVPKVIAIAGGDSKVAGISGALKSGTINICITDENTATSLLA